MHAVTIRRMIVFGVCALGVGSLYLVPSVARSPEQIRLSGATDEAAGSAGEAGPSTPQTSASSTGDRDSLAAGGVASGGTTPDLGRPATDSKSAAASDERSNRKAGARTAKAAKDFSPPQPVTDIEVSKVTAQRLTVSWPAASDNVGVIGYRVWLNGFEVATTAETRARLRWFNDDSGRHVVQIRALDAAGNQSQTSPTLVVTRPSSEPTETPTPEPSDSPTPTGEPSEHSHPEAQSPESPGARASGKRSTADPTPG
jgi:hypothetical protein